MNLVNILMVGPSARGKSLVQIARLERLYVFTTPEANVEAEDLSLSMSEASHSTAIFPTPMPGTVVLSSLVSLVYDKIVLNLYLAMIAASKPMRRRHYPNQASAILPNSIPVAQCKVKKFTMVGKKANSQ
jgi:hypothetical protein